MTFLIIVLIFWYHHSGVIEVCANRHSSPAAVALLLLGRYELFWAISGNHRGSIGDTVSFVIDNGHTMLLSALIKGLIFIDRLLSSLFGP
jgi:hypothetical protein